jgi:hypothetical protein
VGYGFLGTPVRAFGEIHLPSEPAKTHAVANCRHPVVNGGVSLGLPPRSLKEQPRLVPRDPESVISPTVIHRMGSDGCLRSLGYGT